MSVQLELDSVKHAWIESVTPRILAMPREFTTDDLHVMFDPPAQRNWWGVAMAQLRNLGRLEQVGYRKSTRPEANGRKIQLWRIK